MFYENKRELFLLFCEKNPIQFPLHLHQYLELVRIERGCVEMQIGSKKYLLQQGDLAFIFPNIPHDYHTLSGTSDTELHILNCYPTYLPLHTTVLMNNYQKIRFSVQKKYIQTFYMQKSACMKFIRMITIKF